MAISTHYDLSVSLLQWVGILQKKKKKNENKVGVLKTDRQWYSKNTPISS